ncbi:MAG: DegQ family serine endoprotease [Pseudomonadota bacterium]
MDIKSGLRFIFVVLIGLVSSQPLHAALPVSDGQGQPLPSLAPMLEQVLPAVVNISTRGRVRAADNPLMQDPFFRRFFGVPDQPRERATQSLGSGVIVDAKNGYVLTNNHVIDKADEITVTLKDGRSLTATLIGKDPEADVAVIQIPAEKLVAVTLTDSDRVRVGDFVVAIGNPFGLGQTVTSGIVSAKGRSGLGIEGYEDFIQTDASINPGNSGGALVNLRGELVGVNTAILAPGGGNIGIGFAIPVNMLRTLMDQLVAHGEVRRGRVGLSVQDLTADLAKAFGIKETRGAVIAKTLKDSPAEKAGLKTGDVVVAINGKPVSSSAELRNIFGLLQIGEVVVVEVIRDGKPRTLRVTIAEPVSVTLEGKRVSPVLQGATFSAIEEGNLTYGRIEGVLVTKVESGSPAWRAGLRKNDVIVSINRQPVPHLDALQRIVKTAQRGLLINLRRGDEALFILIQ